MKLDNNDHLNFHPSPPRKSYNPFESDDETCDSADLKAGNFFAKEDVNGLEHLTFEKNSDTISFHLDNGDFLWEEALPFSVTNQDAVHGANGVEEPVSVNDTHLYTDKIVTECELPELVVCYKESNSNQSVKDIGIDEGRVVPPSHDKKMWIQSGEEESNKDPCEFLDLDKLCVRSDTDLKVESGESADEVISVKSSESATLPSDDHKKGEEDDLTTPQVASGQYLVHEFAAVDDKSMEISQLKLELGNGASLSNGSTTENLAGESVQEDPVLPDTVLETPDASRPTEPVLKSQDGPLNLSDAIEKKEVDDASEDKSPNQIVLLPEDLGLKVALPEEPSAVTSQEQTKPDESQFLEQESQISAQHPSHLSTTDKESTTAEEESNQNKLSYNSKLESATITFNFDNSSSGTEKEEGGTVRNSDCSKPPDTQAMTRHGEECAAAVNTASSDNTFSSFLERRVQGETSFSQAACPPSSITFAGPVSYSGSISLRSESSAGSTRSFAFPVLQTEWNSSPVRMAKADQRHLKKQRGWVQAVICCKF